MEKQSFTKAEWRKARGISTGRHYELERAGLAPQTYSIASKEYISKEADAEWLKRMEAGAAENFKPLPAKNPGHPGRTRTTGATA